MNDSRKPPTRPPPKRRNMEAIPSMRRSEANSQLFPSVSSPNLTVHRKTFSYTNEDLSQQHEKTSEFEDIANALGDAEKAFLEETSTNQSEPSLPNNSASSQTPFRPNFPRIKSMDITLPSLNASNPRSSPLFVQSSQQSSQQSSPTQSSPVSAQLNTSGALDSPLQPAKQQIHSTPVHFPPPLPRSLPPMSESENPPKEQHALKQFDMQSSLNLPKEQQLLKQLDMLASTTSASALHYSAEPPPFPKSQPPPLPLTTIVDEENYFADDQAAENDEETEDSEYHEDAEKKDNNAVLRPPTPPRPEALPIEYNCQSELQQQNESLQNQQYQQPLPPTPQSPQTQASLQTQFNTMLNLQMQAQQNSPRMTRNHPEHQYPKPPSYPLPQIIPNEQTQTTSTPAFPKSAPPMQLKPPQSVSQGNQPISVSNQPEQNEAPVLGKHKAGRDTLRLVSGQSELDRMRDACVTEIFDALTLLLPRLNEYNTPDKKMHLDDLRGGIVLAVSRTERVLETSNTSGVDSSEVERRRKLSMVKGMLPPGFDRMPKNVQNSYLVQITNVQASSGKPFPKRDPYALTPTEEQEIKKCSGMIAVLVSQKFENIGATEELEIPLEPFVIGAFKRLVKTAAYQQAKKKDLEMESSTLSTIPIKTSTLSTTGEVSFAAKKEKPHSDTYDIGNMIMNEIRETIGDRQTSVEVKLYLNEFAQELCKLSMETLSKAANCIAGQSVDYVSGKELIFLVNAIAYSSYQYCSKNMYSVFKTTGDAKSKKLAKSLTVCSSLIQKARALTQKLLDNSDFEPTVNENVIQDAKSKEKTFIEETVCRGIKKTCKQLHSLMTSYVALLLSIDSTIVTKCDVCVFTSRFLQLFPYTENIVVLIKKLLNEVSTRLELLKITVNPVSLSSTNEDDQIGARTNVWKELRSPILEVKTETNGAQKKLLKSGTINHVVLGIVTGNPPIGSRNAFTTTYRAVCTPLELLRKLIEVYQVPSSLDKKQSDSVKSYVVIVLKYWIEKQYRDFDLDLIREFSSWIATIENANIRNPLFTQLSSRIEQLKKKLSIDNLNWSMDVPQETLNDIFMSVQVDELAETLTFIDCSLFANIIASDLFSFNWSKKEKEFKSPSVSEIAKRATSISRFVEWTVLIQPTAQKRATMLMKFIKVAYNLYRRSNFHTLMSIIGGLMSSSVSRLSITNDFIKKQTRDEFNEIVNVMSPQGSFKVYRERLVKKEHSECFIPYIGVYLSDLTFMHDGNPDFVDAPDGGLQFIYYEKNEMMDKVMEEIRMFQQVNVDFLNKKKGLKKTLCYKYFKQVPEYEDMNFIYDLSLTLEPRGCKKIDVL